MDNRSETLGPADPPPIETPAAQNVVSWDALLARVAHWRHLGHRIALTNGTFDLLHVGHVRSLEWARSRADVLVVGVNSDASVRGYKSADRPIVPDRERAELVAALRCVDLVAIFDEPTAERLVAAVKPDVYVKGGDYSVESLPEAAIVQRYGGRVELVPLHAGRSTSSLIREIARRFGAR